MSEKKDNPGFVRVADCRERHGKLELALWGDDGRGGMVKALYSHVICETRRNMSNLMTRLSKSIAEF
jgi:hypothetical protein